MKILALEFSSPERSVAVVDSDAGSAPRVCSRTAETGVGEMHPLGLINQCLVRAQLSIEEIDRLAVGLGPGSYTGIRSAIALAQGWQLARPVELLGISSVDCLIVQAQAAGLTGPVVVVIDAQRNEWYLTKYLLDRAKMELLVPLRIASNREIQALIQTGDAIIGPQIDPMLPNARFIAPDAVTLGLLAAARADMVPGEQLEPIYLRPTAFTKAPPPRVIE